MTDLIGGQVQFVVNPIPQSMEFVKAGKVRALAVTTAARLAALPDLPTVAEFVPGYEAVGWYGIGAPKDTPADVIGTLNAALTAALARSRAEGAACRSRRRADADDARAIRKIHYQRKRQMEQGHSRRQHQAGLRSIARLASRDAAMQIRECWGNWFDKEGHRTQSIDPYAPPGNIRGSTLMTILADEPPILLLGHAIGSARLPLDALAIENYDLISSSVDQLLALEALQRHRHPSPPHAQHQ